MQFTFKQAGVLSALAVLGLAALGKPAQAQLTALTDPSQLSSGGMTIDYPGNPFDVFAVPLAVTAGGNTLTFSMSNANWERRNEGNGWAGNFAPGTELLWTAGDTTDGITVSFANPVGEFGFFAMNNYYGNETFTLTAFNGATPLGTLLFNGVSSDTDNTATFVGARSTLGDVITSFHLTGTSTGGGNNDMAIAPVTFGSAGTAGGVIPEPSTVAMFASGLLPLAGVGIRRRRRA